MKVQCLTAIVGFRNLSDVCWTLLTNSPVTRNRVLIGLTGDFCPILRCVRGVLYGWPRERHFRKVAGPVPNWLSYFFCKGNHYTKDLT